MKQKFIIFMVFGALILISNKMYSQPDSLKNQSEQVKAQQLEDEDRINDLKGEKDAAKAEAKEAQQTERDATSASHESKSALKKEKKAQKARKKADEQSRRAEKARNKSAEN